MLVSLAFGVPTIKRGKASYVIDTIQSLVKGTSAEEKNDCIIIIFIAEIEDTIFVNGLIKTLIDRYLQANDCCMQQCTVCTVIAFYNYFLNSACTHIMHTMFYSGAIIVYTSFINASP